jgi:hypothetical protein
VNRLNKQHTHVVVSSSDSQLGPSSSISWYGYRLYNASDDDKDYLSEDTLDEPACYNDDLHQCRPAATYTVEFNTAQKHSSTENRHCSIEDSL